MPNTLTTIFTSTPSTEPVESPHPNTGAYTTGTQLANGTWQVVHMLVTKTSTPPTITGRQKNYPAIAASVVATGGPNNGNVFNNILAAPTGTSAVASSTTAINATVSSNPNATAYRLLSATTAGGAYAQIYQGAAAGFAHTGLTAGTTYFYQWQYAGGGFYDDSPLSAVFSAATSAAVATPTITSLAPNSGPIGTQVTITGTNFGDTQSTGNMKFNGIIATIVTWAATSVVAIVPTGCQTGPVTLVNSSGQTAVSPGPYTVGAKDIHLVVDGMSIAYASGVANGGASQVDAFALGVVKILRAALQARGDTRQIIYSRADNVAVPSQTTHQMRVSATDVTGAYNAQYLNLLLVMELYNQFRPNASAGEGLAATVTDPAAVAAAVSAGIDTMQGYCADRLAEHADWKIVVGAPGPDKYNGNVAPYSPPRSNFYSAIQVPVRDQLKALKANGTAGFNAIADVTSDTIFDPSDPAQSPDGVHPNDYGYDKGNICARYAAACLEVLFGTPQPAPVLAATATTTSAPVASAANMPFGADNNVIINNGSNGYYTNTGGAAGSYGNLTYTGYKLVGAGCYGHKTPMANALDVVLVLSAQPQKTAFGASLMGTWNSSQSGDGTDTVHRLSRFDSSASPTGVRTGRPTTVGDAQAIFRVVNPAGNGQDAFVLRASVDNGQVWADVYTYAFTIATGVPVYLGADFSGPGACYNPFAIGAVAA